MKKTTLFVIIIIAIVFSLFHIFSQKRNNEVASFGRDQREQQINVHSTINIYDSLSHAIHVSQKVILYRKNHPEIQPYEVPDNIQHVIVAQ